VAVPVAAETVVAAIIPVVTVVVAVIGRERNLKWFLVNVLMEIMEKL
jgi:hypothetical protein